MYPERDSQADAFDDAFERRRAGDTTSDEHQELHELVNLAVRLEEELPDDLPDPGFRNNLKQQLLEGSIQPDVATDPAEAPASIEEERWFRRLVASPWRLSAAAAACLIVVVVAFMSTGVDLFNTDSSDSSEEVTSFRPVDTDDPPANNDIFRNDQFPLDTEDSAIPSEQWFTASFPPFDSEHVVLPPLMLGFLPLSERKNPRVELNGMDGMTDDVEMPGSGSIYYLNAPPDGSTMLTTISSILGVEGELIESTGDGEPFRVVDDDQNDILRWDPTSAFFHFQGGLLDEPIDGLLDPEASETEIARRFLELIGFDLHTIEYEEHLVENEDTFDVHFRPLDFPETGLDVTLGGKVVIGPEGAVLEAQLYWLSLVDIEVVALRDPDDVIADIENGTGFAPPVSSDDDEDVVIDAADMSMVHILTRLGDSHFVLQPAVHVVGEYEDDIESSMPGPARYVIPAVEN